jgi:hypothetical protein
MQELRICWEIKRVIRHKSTLEYLKSGSWVSDFNLADWFADIKSALDACQKHKLNNVELVLILGEKPSEQYDVVLPIRNSAHNT